MIVGGCRGLSRLTTKNYDEMMVVINFKKNLLLIDDQLQRGCWLGGCICRRSVIDGGGNSGRGERGSSGNPW